MSTAAPTRQRVLAQTSFEARAILRNGEQLLVTQLSVGRRTLEDVFLDLTGRNLR